MGRKPQRELRRGWTTGACATAAVKAALTRAWTDVWPDPVEIDLPKGERPAFALAHRAEGDGWVEAGIIKDAGDDPDVTHGAMIVARVERSDGGVVFRGGEGVGLVTKPGLPIAPGEPAINPVPRQMMEEVVGMLAAETGHSPDVTITIRVPGGAEIARKTWNPRLGIEGGLSILGTTGVVRPFSCAAWIASIHRGIDVARAAGLPHVAGSTGATSEAVVQGIYDLPDHGMLDMGDFVGGLVKYLRAHPVPRLTIGGGIGKMTKLAQGARDLHSGRSQVDFKSVAEWLEAPDEIGANSALDVLSRHGDRFGQIVAERALAELRDMAGREIEVDTIVIDRTGRIVGRAGP